MKNVNLLSSYLAQVRPDALRRVLAMVALTITEALFFLRALIHKSYGLPQRGVSFLNAKALRTDSRVASCEFPEPGTRNPELETLANSQPISCRTRVKGLRLKVRGARLSFNL
jgi:hypothetical protein